MLKLSIHRHARLFYVLKIVTIIVFSGTLASVLYIGNQSVAVHERQSATYVQESKIFVAKAKDRDRLEAIKLAAEKKAQEEAERKAAAEAALTAQQAGEVVTPKGCAGTGPHSNPSLVDVVINKKRCFSPIDFTPGDLTSFNGFVVSAKIVPDLTSMSNAAAAAGTPLSLTSSYRSYANQVTTYNTWVRTNGSTAAADTVSARPGYSEHQTGFAVDFSAGSCSLECFRGSMQYAWMQSNAANFGFIERYQPGFEAITGYSAEAWHWRYVGVATAKQMKASGVKTLEELWNVKGGGY